MNGENIKKIGTTKSNANNNPTIIPIHFSAFSLESSFFYAFTINNTLV